MIKYILIPAFFMAICSCSTGIPLTAHQTKNIDSSLSATFKNDPYYRKWPQKECSILSILEIKDSAKGDLITMRFVGTHHLLVTYYDSLLEEYNSEMFRGKFKKNGYFQLYVSRRFIWVPLIYRLNRYNKLRLRLTNENDLIIYQSKKEHVYMLLGRAGGSYGRNSLYFFEAVEETDVIL